MQDISLEGSCTVMRGKTLLGKAMAFFAKIPPAGENIPIKVIIRRTRNGVQWIRSFGKHEMTSTLRNAQGLLSESLGPARFLFRLQGSEQGIRWIPVRIRAMGIPLPLRLFDFDIREYADQERYHFNVKVEIVGLGLLVHYQGRLEADV